MNPSAKRRLGNTGVEVTQLGLGGAHLGDLYVAVGEGEAEETVRTAYEAGIGFFDTSPWYGCGKSEHRLGHYLRAKPFHDFVLSTKVGRVFFRSPDPENYANEFWKGALPFDLRFDYTYDGIMRSYEDSLQRLGMPRVDLLLVHDLDITYHETEERVEARLDDLSRSGWKALQELRASGEIKGIGAGINELGMVPRFLKRFAMDFFLVAMPYTLLDQNPLEREFPLCEERNVGIVIGSPYSSGILATGPVEGAYYAYQPADEAVRDRVARIETVCRRYQVPLQSAALQFPLGHPSVAAVIPGSISPTQVLQNIAALGVEIPADLWAELKTENLIRKDAPTP